MKSPAEFKGIMPYASELLGIYQPLRRWAFRILGNRFEKFRNALYTNVGEQARSSQRAPKRAGGCLMRAAMYARRLPPIARHSERLYAVSNSFAPSCNQRNGWCIMSDWAVQGIAAAISNDRELARFYLERALSEWEAEDLLSGPSDLDERLPGRPASPPRARRFRGCRASPAEWGPAPPVPCKARLDRRADPTPRPFGVQPSAAPPAVGDAKV